MQSLPHKTKMMSQIMHTQYRAMWC